MNADIVAYQDQVRARIRERGWAVLDVPAPDGADDLMWVYTAGLTEVGIAELVMVDIPGSDFFVTGAASCLEYLAGMSLDNDLQPGHTYEIATTNRVRVEEAPAERYPLPWMVRELYGQARLLLVTPIYE